MLKINSNGSKWAGQQPDSIDDLLNVLENYTLDPTFEKTGNFITDYKPIRWTENNRKYEGCKSFFGNFSTLSHVFNIITDDKEIIEKLTNAIRKNQLTAQYQEYRNKMIEIDELNKTLPYGKRKILGGVL